jgi:hypothetical protein
MIPEALEDTSVRVDYVPEDHSGAYTFREGNGVHVNAMVYRLTQDHLCRQRATYIGADWFSDKRRWSRFLSEYRQYVVDSLDHARQHPLEVSDAPHDSLCHTCDQRKECLQPCIQQQERVEKHWLAVLNNVFSYSASVLICRVFFGEGRQQSSADLFRFPLIPNGIYKEQPMLPPEPVVAIEGDEEVDLWQRRKG